MIANVRQAFDYYRRQPDALVEARKRETLLNWFLRSRSLEPGPSRLPTDEDVAKAADGVNDWNPAHGREQ